MLKYKTFMMGNNVTCTIYFNHRICEALYALPQNKYNKIIKRHTYHPT
jgi:hypothetical protein